MAVYSGLTLTLLKAKCLNGLRALALDYSRYTEANILNALNDTLIEAVQITKCLRAAGIIDLSDGTQQYAVPDGFLEIDRAFFYTSSTNYWELSQKTRAWLDRNKPGWRIVEGSPTVVYFGDIGTYGSKLGFYPTPDTNGSGTDLSDIVSNVWLEYIKMPDLLSAADSKPNIPIELHPYLHENVVWLMKRTSKKGTPDYMDAEAGRQAFLGGMHKYKERDNSMRDVCISEYNL